MFEVDFGNGSAREKVVTKWGNVKIRNYKMFINSNGIYVSTRKGVVYLTPENSIIL